MRRCAECDDPLSFAVRADTRYCSTRCRVAAHRAGLPSELRALPRWVRYSARKVPLAVKGGAASSTDPATWGSYAKAAGSPLGVGLGFVLNGDGVVCIDLDDCLDGDALTPWARDLLASIPPTYVEVSPSGRGLHVWGRGEVERGRRIGKLEVYGDGRYITVTGKRWAGAVPRLGDLSAALGLLVA